MGVDDPPESVLFFSCHKYSCVGWIYTPMQRCVVFSPVPGIRRDLRLPVQVCLGVVRKPHAFPLRSSFFTEDKFLEKKDTPRPSMRTRAYRSLPLLRWGWDFPVPLLHCYGCCVP